MEKWYPIDPYIWVALSQTWCSKMNLLNHHKSKSIIWAHAKFHRTNANIKNLIDNLFPTYRSSSNIVPRKRYPNKGVKRRSSICNNNGKIINPRHRITFWHTIRHNTNNTYSSIKLLFSNKIITNLQNQKMYKENKHKKTRNIRKQITYFFIHLL